MSWLSFKVHKEQRNFNISCGMLKCTLRSILSNVTQFPFFPGGLGWVMGDGNNLEISQYASSLSSLICATKCSPKMWQGFSMIPNSQTAVSIAPCTPKKKIICREWDPPCTPKENHHLQKWDPPLHLCRKKSLAEILRIS